MSLRQKYEKILRAMGPAGALGAAFVLCSAGPGMANPEPAQPAAAPAPVAERLAAVREAVSAVAGEQAAAKAGDKRLAWGNWWRNGGWRGPWGNWGYYARPWGNWHNWNNWGNWFRNW